MCGKKVNVTYARLAKAKKCSLPCNNSTMFCHNTCPSLLSQRYLYPSSMLLHHHGVLCPRTAIWGAESRQEDPSIPAHGLGYGHRWGDELSSSPQDHPQRPQVPKVSSPHLLNLIVWYLHLGVYDHFIAMLITLWKLVMFGTSCNKHLCSFYNLHLRWHN